MLIPLFLLLLSSKCSLGLPKRSGLPYSIRPTCFNIDLCREVSSDGLCDLECSSAECAFDGGDCDSINEIGAKLMLALHISPTEFMFVSHRFLSEMSSITRSRVEMARDSQDLLMWEWDPEKGPTRRLYPESQESPYGISSIQIMISIKLIDCPRECGKLIEESIRLWYESIKDDNLSHFMSEMLYEDDESEPIADSTLIILAVLVTAGLICIIFAVISLIRRRKRHITGFEIPDNLPDLHMCPLDPIERIEVKEINRLEKGQDSPLHSIVASNNQSIEEDIEALLKYGESINTIDREGRSVLHVSLVYRRSSQFIRWLISKGADPSTVDDKNQSLLHFSVSNNDLDIVSILLEFPVVARMINHCDYRNMTPLKLAMIESPIEICRLLIDCGAMVDFSGIKGYDPLLCHRSPIHLAVMNDNLEQVELLLERGANINSVDDRGRTALHYAVIYSEMEMVEILIDEEKCEVNRRDNDMKTAEDLARINGKIEVVNLLMEVAAEHAPEEIRHRYRKNLRLHRSRDFIHLQGEKNVESSYHTYVKPDHLKGKSVYSNSSDEGVYSDYQYPELPPRCRSTQTLYYL